ncbi:hypothetical protein ACWCXB_17070 [Streptomyces sp. NPDC001514]
MQQSDLRHESQAATEADALLAKDRGFPDGEQFEEQTAAIPVHHADRVEGYRRMHTAVRGQGGTEEAREAMVEARGLFDTLITEESADSGRHRQQSPDDHRHTPWTRSRHHA